MVVELGRARLTILFFKNMNLIRWQYNSAIVKNLIYLIEVDGQVHELKSINQLAISLPL